MNDESDNFGFFDDDLQMSAFNSGSKEAKRVQQEETDDSDFFDDMPELDPNSKIEQINNHIASSNSATLNNKQQVLRVQKSS